MLVAYYVILFLVVRDRMLWTPSIKPETSDPQIFSEERAMKHVEVLTEVIGDHQVSTPGLEEATQYMLKEANRIRQLGEDMDDVEVEVHLDTVSGEVAMDFTLVNLTNVYRGLDNIALVIRRKGLINITGTMKPDEPKSLLIASHYDSAVCSYGAADDGAQVAAMLEVARALLYRRPLPRAPVVFLWTGGEEPFSPAAHGWMRSSSLVPSLGAFINLEAMGTGGLPILFQHTGAWTMEAYARGAPFARGSRVAQDIFDANLIPADSDYRMFSALHYGHLPGIDVAYVMDSTSYHSYLDRPARMRKGVVQEMGENLLGAITSFTDYLTDHPSEAAQPEHVTERAVYFDILGLVMVSYRDRLAVMLHNVPATIALGLPLIAHSSNTHSLTAAYKAMGHATLRTFASIVLAILFPALLGAGRTLLSALLGAGRTLLSGMPMVWYSHQSLGLLIYLPVALLGALIPHLGIEKHAEQYASGRPGLYLGAQMQGCALAGGMAAAGLTAVGLIGNGCVFALASVMSSSLSLLLGTPRLHLSLLLLALATALIPLIFGMEIMIVFVAVIMERMGIAGHISVLLADVVVGVLCGLAVLACTCGAMLPLIAYSISGVRKQVIAVLLLVSFGASTYGSLYVHPYSVTSPKRVALNHLHFTVATDVGHHPASTSVENDTPVHSEVSDHQTGCLGRLGVPQMTVVSNRFAYSPTDSVHIDFALNHSEDSRLPDTGMEFTSVFPLTNLLAGGGRNLDASYVLQPAAADSDKLVPQGEVQGAAGQRVRQLPYVCRTAEDVWDMKSSASGLRSKAESSLGESLAGGVDEDGGRSKTDGQHSSRCAEGKRRRVNLMLFTERAAWGVLNVTVHGGMQLTGWSFGSQLMPSLIKGTQDVQVQHIARLLLQNQSSHVVEFWLEVADKQAPAGGLCSEGHRADGRPSFPDSQAGGATAGVRVELSISYLDKTEALMQAKARLPEEWVSEIWLATVYYSAWEL
ncbi:hypothetical protein CEUSTIGMA_g3412.t1 [Chlamydomonas eustigma]|uniref:Peptidase M28 domain-containing protein n=1 Tax=Chlamydomonas eustigma TaxID=1157962 RepID=A0A250WZ47_9CHLO|nr:hypothetical protein CEUSTIGMA_g3412.t1 [Chlamydomonas eustigma]|eukprot:GAX75969.1 hypothetical protein CEUSTIGMA_g3412.t1 [Chlamydomonas eustigma]